MNSFIDLLKRAAGLWWRTRILWPLGMLAAFVGAGDLSVGGSFNVSQPFPTDVQGNLPPWIEDLAGSPLVRDIIANPLPYLAGLIVLSIGVALVATLVGALAHGAMIRVADVADQGYRASLGDGLGVGLARMLPIFLINLLLALPVIAVVAGLIAVLIVFISALVQGGPGADTGQIFASALGLILCVLAVGLGLSLVGALLGVLARVAQRACVIERLGPVASLKRGWGLIRRNMGLTLLNWLLMVAVGALIGVLVAIPAVGLAFPVLLAATSDGAFPVAPLVAAGIYTFAASVILGGLLTAFNSTLWTVIYRHFAAREASVTTAPPPYTPAPDRSGSQWQG